MGMQIKKFRAPTLQKALEQIRAELGDGAIILQADPVKGGLLGRHGVEVTAAIDRKNLSPRFEVKLDDSGVERPSALEKESGSTTKWKGLFQKSAAQPKKTSAANTDKKPVEQVKDFVKKAAEDDSPSPTMGQMFAMKTFVEPLKKEVEQLKTQLNNDKKRSTPERVPSTALLENEIQSLKSTLECFIHEQRLKEGDWDESLRKLERFWRERGMGVNQIAHFFSQVHKHNKAFQAYDLQTTLEKRIAAAKAFETRNKKVLVLVGPTGVGKTTTIAKLAAFEKLKLHRKVALVTIDDYKIGGTDQLGHYARILDVPFLKCRSDFSLEEQIKGFDADTIFVDTFGVSPKDDHRITKLRKTLNFKNQELQAQQELHLVLPVGISSGDVDTYLQSFSRMNPHYLLFTKWDETNNWGGMLAAILTSQRPVSFVGHGQEVPDDISAFDSRNFIETITSLEN